MRAVFPILLKEILHIVRDMRSLIAAILLPLGMLLLFGFAVNLDVERVEIAVIDRDNSAASRELLAQVTADGSVIVSARPHDEPEMERLLDAGEVRMGVIVPRGFGRMMGTGERAPVQVLVDGAEASFAGMALNHVGGAITWSAQRRLDRALRDVGFGDELPGLVVEPRIFFNEALDSRWFIVPGLIAVLLMQLAALLTSQCVAREYERNTIEQILVSPVSGPALMMGKLLPYVGLGVIQVALVVTASSAIFHVPIRGSLGLLGLATLLYLTGSMALGLLFSAALKNQQLAMQVSVVATTLPSILLSGFIFPIDNMPRLLQLISYAVPARYYIEITRGLFLKGVGMDVLWPNMLAMGVFATVLIAASVSRFQRSLA